MSERAWIGAQVAIVLVVLAAAVYGLSIGVGSPPPAGASVSPQAQPISTPTASSTRTSSPRPTVTPAPAGPSATPSPTPTRKPLALSPYAFNGHSYTGVTLGTGWTIVAPFDGRAGTHVYQLVDGQIRDGTDVAGIPSYPYVIVTAADGRKMTYRPGALGTDTQPIVRTSDVKTGDALFSVIGTGLSSWHDFYDPTITFQIVVSLVSGAGADLDASSLIKAK